MKESREIHFSEVRNMSDEELALMLTKSMAVNAWSNDDLSWKLNLQAEALSRILSRLNDPAVPKTPPYEP